MELSQANALSPNWGQHIFQSANEIASNAAFKKRLDEIQAKAPADKQWWEKRRASIQSELGIEDTTSKMPVPVISRSLGGSDENAILIEGGGPPVSDKGSIRKKKGKK